MLLLRANSVVSVDTLTEAVWGEHPPAGAGATLRVYVANLRKLVDPEPGRCGSERRLVHEGAGYRLRVAPTELDLLQFGQHLLSARQAADHGDFTSAATEFRHAENLWRGPPMPDLVGSTPAEPELAGLVERRLSAVEDRIDLELALGRHSRLVAELDVLCSTHPLRERLQAQRILALYRDRRQADALAAYREVRAMLVDELGVDPGPALRKLERRILTHDPSLEPPVPGSEPTTTQGAVPHELPAAVTHFTGRSAELAALTALTRDQPDAEGAVVIAAIRGTAGVGKTTLAVHWAHHMADQFPDGQLYVNLRGFDPGGAATAPPDVVRRFLEALQVAPERIPVDPEAQAALYRSRLAGRRMLILLDNARDAAQVRPLLPGAPGCLVLVTSRNQLAGLVAAEDAHPLSLDLLRDDEARELLSVRLGNGRIASEPDAAREIIAACARLPLALAIVAARAAAHPTFPLAALAKELREASDRLDALTGEDSASDVRAVFSWSYERLSPDAARLFRLLGLHPGPDLSAGAAASLAGVPPRVVRPLLAELTHAHLILEHAPSRYTLHDLLRAYAAEQADNSDDESVRRAAMHRVLDYYVQTSSRAADLLDPIRDPVDGGKPQPEVFPENFDNHQLALDWFDVEHPVVLAAIERAAANGFDTETWQLAWALADYLDWRGSWETWAATGRTAVAAANRLSDPRAQAAAHRLLGRAYSELSRVEDTETQSWLDEAGRQLHSALQLYDRVGEPVGKGLTHINLAMVSERRRGYAEALGHCRQALVLFRAVGHRRAEAQALNNVGWYCARLGRYEQALRTCQHALALHQGFGHRAGQASTWDSVGFAHHHLGHHSEAITAYEHALRLNKEIGHRHGEAENLMHLGEAHQARGDLTAARRAWQCAFAILEDLHDPDADQVRTKLVNLGRLDG